MPERAKVFIAEDDPDAAFIWRFGLERAGHTVIATALDLQTALDTINNSQTFDVDVALVDGNLRPGDTSFSDGEKISNALKARNPNIKVIAISSLPDTPYGDIQLVKSGAGFLPQLIREVGKS